MQDRCTASGSVGYYLSKNIQNFISILKFKGYDIDIWMSNSGLVRTFILTGDRATVELSVKLLKETFEELNREKESTFQLM